MNYYRCVGTPPPTCVHARVFLLHCDCRRRRPAALALSRAAAKHRPIGSINAFFLSSSAWWRQNRARVRPALAPRTRARRPYPSAAVPRNGSRAGRELPFSFLATRCATHVRTPGGQWPGASRFAFASPPVLYPRCECARHVPDSTRRGAGPRRGAPARTPVAAAPTHSCTRRTFARTSNETATPRHASTGLRASGLRGAARIEKQPLPWDGRREARCDSEAHRYALTFDFFLSKFSFIFSDFDLFLIVYNDFSQRSPHFSDAPRTRRVEGASISTFSPGGRHLVGPPSPLQPPSQPPIVASESQNKTHHSGGVGSTYWIAPRRSHTPCQMRRQRRFVRSWSTSRTEPRVPSAKSCMHTHTHTLRSRDQFTN